MRLPPEVQPHVSISWLRFRTSGGKIHHLRPTVKQRDPLVVKTFGSSENSRGTRGEGLELKSGVFLGEELLAELKLAVCFLLDRNCLTDVVKRHCYLMMCSELRFIFGQGRSPPWDAPMQQQCVCFSL